MTAWLDLTEVPYSVTWVDAGGVMTRALQAGSGPDVIFLHGTSGHLWQGRLVRPLRSSTSFPITNLKRCVRPSKIWVMPASCLIPSAKNA